MKRFALRSGEPLAISASDIRRDADGFFLEIGSRSPDNETRGTVTIVNVRGALQQFRDDWGDSYEGIVDRVRSALESDPKPTTILLRVSSPGGLVAGLNETAATLRRMSSESGVPLVAFVDELAASAAYAICCACSQILAPPSAVVGSVGVISTMVSLARRDEAEGVDFRLVTSGKRKADGHLHAPITEDAVRAERTRVAQLAAQFYTLAATARKVKPAKLAGLEAAIFLAQEAERVGLVDEVLSLDDALLGLDRSTEAGPAHVAPNEGNVTDRRAEPSAQLDTAGPCALLAQHGTHGAPDMLKLAALIKRLTSAHAAESDPKAKVALYLRLTAAQSTLAEMGGDGDGDEGGDEGDGGDGDEGKAAKAAKAAAKAKSKAEGAKHRAKAAEHKAKAAEYEDAAKKCEEEATSGEEDEEDEAASASPPQLALSDGAAAAITSQAELGREALARIERLEKSAAKRELAAMVEEARATRRITPGEAKVLSSKSAAFVRDFLSMRLRPLVATEEEALAVPDGAPDGDVPASVKSLTERAIAAMGAMLKDEDARKAFREKAFSDYRAEKARVVGGVTH
jgi:ClpP class serine protease